MSLPPFNTPLPPENTDPWYAPLVAVWAALTAYVNGLATAIAGKAPLVHTHAAGDITSGTLVVARIPDLSQSKITGLTAALAGKADLIDGFVPTSQLPPIAITEFLGAVDSEAAMLALTGQRGDWAVRTDVSSLAILAGEPSSTLANWQLIEIGAGAAGVSSINGQSGIVILGFSDVGAASAAQGALADTALQPGDVGTAAFESVEAFATAAQGAKADTAVQFDDLGTAATSEATDFATAAQGALADTALQPGATSAPPDFGIMQAAFATRNTSPVPIVFAGSSTVAGEGASAVDRQFAAVLTAQLQAAYPLRSGVAQPSYKALAAAVAALPLSPGIQGVNAGINGRTAANFLDATTRAQIGDLAPRVVVIQVGSNDYAGNIPPADYRATLETQLTGLRAEVAGPCLYVLVQQYRRGDVTSPTYAWELYGQALQEIAADADDVIFVNTQPYFDAVGVPDPDPLDLILDTVHPTDAGHAMIADLLLRALGVPLVGTSSTVPPPTGQVTVAHDEFNRADGALGTAPSGQAWTAVGGTVISGNRGGGTGAGTATIQPDIRDLEIEAALTWNSSSVGLVFRGDTNANRLGIFIQSGNIVFYRNAANVTTAVAQQAFTTTAGATYLMRVRVSGNTMTVYINGVLFFTFTIDATSEAAVAGLSRAGWRVGAAGNFVDNFVVRTLL